ncbi:16S rRNA (cytosine(1402)-N(4))-methyltransferase RsmH, partial [candidate division KSB1 bacterium]|nr:16S rRNA (cytosine(1402)-N(4))-methyltransferase RsmH [candidate division KSB1 bacterium]NIR71838.1 16S rRNA (cytosine(1402)-N(4))-methyltransferase RsmH [candidate division KSB1 bacterium]NIT71824.1 16S rRNA (cytosine(1402)-N(4))-methyltransferase RsmH [candidate division KSB1 bacterium]NIU93079.1 16S rRNA (cytosine(1402)-N(4))-methyltransferase RsmH [candidate division KSB1 bacterium]NIW19411.1 16S rRNA (cytosine(1402)-N(4))-methyltransferase RsmH [candidate division KSB1 bacterium]
MFHKPVLVEEVMVRLLGEPNGVYVDGTVGGGGHARAILKALGPRGKLIALDRDEEAIRHAKAQLKAFGNRLIVRKGNFKEFNRVLEELNIKRIHGLLLDLGVSSHQIDTAERGFSYGTTGDLDMRMDQQQDRTAGDIVNTWSEDELFRAFKAYGEERRSRAVARIIIKERKRTRI